MNTQSETFTPLVCYVIDDALFNAMPAIHSRYEFLWGRPAAEFLCKFCSSVGSDLGVGGIDLIK